MASHPPGQCCVVGVHHEGTPTGKMIKVGHHDAYLATASSQNARQGAGLLYVPDVLGIWDNSKLLADEFAANGYTTLIIDLFNGDAIDVNRFDEVDLPDWVQNGRNGAGGHTTKEIDPIMEEALAYMKTEMGLVHIGAVGYCFGAKYLLRHYQNGIEVGFIAHPSFIEEDELAAITGPLSIAAAETDSIFPAEKRHRSEEILKENGSLYQVNLFSGVVHGFAVRCDLRQKHERFAKEQAFMQAFVFFNAWLGL
ncbi:dienelactone hydrolase [Ilyonectria destructans]|nr:dienelactone hydrolase [Ilyonectria destructans]